jgi:hypothetical protein
MGLCRSTWHAGPEFSRTEAFGGTRSYLFTAAKHGAGMFDALIDAAIGEVCISETA